MKKEQFSDLMNQIDDRLIESAMPLPQSSSKSAEGRKELFPARSRVWKIAYACICVGIAAVLLVPAMMKTANVPDDIPLDTIAPIKYSIYCDESAPKKAISEITVIDSSQKVQYVNSKLEKFNYAAVPIELEKNTDAEPTRTFTLGDQTYTFHYCRSYGDTWMNSDLSHLKQISILDEYETDQEQGDYISIRWIRGTNMISDYLNYTACKVDSGDFSTDQATLQAEKDLVELYGKKFASRYTLESVSVDPTFGTSIFVSYRYMINDYISGDGILLAYNLRGELESLSAYGIGIFSHVTEQLTAERLEKAETVLKASIPDQVEQSEAMIVLDKEGVPYLQINGTYVYSSGEKRITQYYINIY